MWGKQFQETRQKQNCRQFLKRETWMKCDCIYMAPHCFTTLGDTSRQLRIATVYDVGPTGWNSMSCRTRMERGC